MHLTCFFGACSSASRVELGVFESVFVVLVSGAIGGEGRIEEKESGRFDNNN